MSQNRLMQKGFCENVGATCETCVPCTEPAPAGRHFISLEEQSLSTALIEMLHIRHTVRLPLIIYPPHAAVTHIYFSYTSNKARVSFCNVVKSDFFFRMSRSCDFHGVEIWLTITFLFLEFNIFMFGLVTRLRVDIDVETVTIDHFGLDSVFVVILCWLV